MLPQPRQTQPCRHIASFCRSRHLMICVALENTDSISTNSIGSIGCSGGITRLTRKCFCLSTGVTAVHLLKSSFLGFRGFMAGDRSELKKASSIACSRASTMLKAGSAMPLPCYALPYLHNL